MPAEIRKNHFLQGKTNGSKDKSGLSQKRKEKKKKPRVIPKYEAMHTFLAEKLKD